MDNTERYCEWKYDDGYSFYERECGGVYDRPYALSLKRNDIIYCPKCGRKIKVVK